MPRHTTLTARGVCPTLATSSTPSCAATFVVHAPTRAAAGIVLVRAAPTAGREAAAAADAVQGALLALVDGRDELRTSAKQK